MTCGKVLKVSKHAATSTDRSPVYRVDLLKLDGNLFKILITANKFT
jgi:hypothetical protein